MDSDELAARGSPDQSDADEYDPELDLDFVPQPPLYYLAIRVTIPHDEWDDLYKALRLNEVPMWISYAHFGKDGNNQHFHIAIPTTAPEQDMAKFRQRLSRAYAGNKQYSMKKQVNGLLAAIQYMAREKPCYCRCKGEHMRHWIEAAPEWEDKPLVQSTLDKKRRNPDTLFQISFSNMFKVCARHSAQYPHLQADLIKTLEHMCNTGLWQLAIGVTKGGIPENLLHQYQQFHLPREKRCHQFGKLLYKPGYLQWN